MALGALRDFSGLQRTANNKWLITVRSHNSLHLCSTRLPAQTYGKHRTQSIYPTLIHFPTHENLTIWATKATLLFLTPSIIKDLTLILAPIASVTLLHPHLSS